MNFTPEQLEQEESEWIGKEWDMELEAIRTETEAPTIEKKFMKMSQTQRHQTVSKVVFGYEGDATSEQIS